MAFDPDAFLGKVTGSGEDDERPAFLDKKSGKGAFDPDAFLARAGGAPAEQRTFVKADGTSVPNFTSAEVRADTDRAKAEVPKQVAANAAIPEAIGSGVIQGATLGFSDELEGVARRAKDVLLGRTGKTYSEYRNESRAMDAGTREAHPVAYGAGEVGGGLATMLIPGAAVGAGAGAGRAAVNAAKVGAVAGAGNSEADLTEGEVGKFAKDVGTSAAVSGAIGGATSKLVRGSPTRVDERLVSNISRGPAGGAAKDKLYKNVVAKAGEEFEDLNEVLSRNPGVKASLVLNAANNPAKSAKIVTRVIDRVDGELSPMYRQIDAGPAPMSAVALQNRLIELQHGLKEAGNTGMADVVEKFENHLAKHYGDGDAIKDGARLTASALRRLKGEVGEIAFKGDAPGNTPFRTLAQQKIYGAINETIEEAAAATPGVSVERMRLLNKDASTLIAVRDALADRGVKDKSGRTSLFQIMAATSMAGGGFASGGIDGAVLGAVTAAGMKAAQPVARGIDFNLAKLVTAARNGSTNAQLGQMAIELGLSRAAADEIQRRGIGALTQQP
jgi:hypothetical protein